MDLHRIDLNLLVAFDAFMTERNVTRAGRRLGLSQSAASGVLARLRVVLDDKLFIRGPGGVVPTPRAEQLIGPLRAAFSSIERAIGDKDCFDPLSSERTFRVAMSDPLSLTLLPQLLTRLRDRAPGCKVRVMRWEGHQVEHLLLEEKMDLALGVIGKSASPIRRQKLVTEDMGCLVRRGHPLSEMRLTPKRFSARGHILVSPRGKDRGRMDGALEKLGMIREVVLVVPDWTSAALILTESDLFLTGPVSVLRTLAEVHDLVHLALPSALQASAVLSSAWHARFDDDPAHQWFREQVAAAAA